MMTTIIKKDRVAVITGAGAGIGAAAAKYFSEHGMKIVLFDKDEIAVNKVANMLRTENLVVVGDVAKSADLQRLYDKTFDSFDEVALVFNNAAITEKGMPWDGKAVWSKIIDTNFLSIVEVQHLFLPKMLKQNQESAIVNLGSKEGITTPPGNAAYSVTKAAIKVLTEQLQHELRNMSGHKVSSHLLVPGYTWTPMNFPDSNFDDQNLKPDSPWSPEEVLRYFHERFENGDFYIICLDNEVTKDMDDRRMRWAMDDIINNRSALSRWDKKYKAEFDEWMRLGPLEQEK